MIPENTFAANIRSDQMGVELGKVLAKAILAQLSKPEDVTGHDSSVRISMLSPSFPDTETSHNRPPASFITTRSTGRSRSKRVILYGEVCKNVTSFEPPWIQIQNAAWKDFGQFSRSGLCSTEKRSSEVHEVWLCA